MPATAPTSAPPTCAATSPQDRVDLCSPAVARAWRRWLLLFLVVGAACRIEQYLLRPSYWNDEAAIVHNVLSRPYTQLLRPLDYAQVAPPLFLWSERAMDEIFGPSEFSMRLIPLLMGLASVALLAVLAWRILPPPSAAVAVGFFAMSDLVIFHSGEAKQYSADMLMAIVLLLAAMPPRTQPAAEGAQDGHPDGDSAVAHRFSIGAGRFFWTAIVASIALWFSFPILFLFTAVSLTAGASLLRRATARRPFDKARFQQVTAREVMAYASGNLLFLGSFLLLYGLVLRRPANRELYTFWLDNHGFPDFSSRWHLVRWLGLRIVEWLGYPLHNWSWGLLIGLLLLCGIAALRRLGRGSLLKIFLLAIAANLLAACVQRYPFAGNRLILYLFPAAFLIAAAGAEPLLLPASEHLKRWWWIIPGILLTVTCVQSLRHVFRPEPESTIRPVVDYVRAHRRPGDAIYLAGDANPRRDHVTGRNVEFLCYWQHPPEPWHFQLPDPAHVPASEHDLWIVISLKKHELDRARTTLHTLMAPFATEDDHFTVQGATAIRFHLITTNPPPSQPTNNKH